MAQIDTTLPVPARARRRCIPADQFESLGRWVPIELVAEGPLTCVYRARAGREGEEVEAICDENDERPATYALKVLHQRWQQDAKALAVMCREVQAARAIRHPHVIPVLAAGLREPPYYVVTPWLCGRTLRDRLADCRPLDLPVTLWIVRQVAEALDGMHEAGWMHGDVKPGNVFISPEGHVTLLDLGFARGTGESNAVDRRYFTGTGSYLAPESAGSTLAADIRSDIYSLGVVLFEMLAGRLPFVGEDAASLIDAHRLAAVPDPRRFAPQIPVDVKRLVRQMLCKQPLRRPQTPRELAGLLCELEIKSFGERTFAGIY